MNTQLVNSIVQVFQALPPAEQKLLMERLNSCFTPTPSENEEPISEAAWEVWRSLGDDAVEGKLENPSINHDRYLYSNPHE
ncbi:hypothetical protein K9N68_38570 (plasmid) [Kovacikia minuta CCNUW1]|uniref:hypothetical protein n=1 Tax=Kovacikia minuta TaxID=2931930 RepID=UPI001CC9CD84|nr:hypothetical protein [Kovacikia minuta]UBF30090.1 hypothetical protein K9N68_38570 [Kovacikia minuta CCNUW1]